MNKVSLTFFYPSRNLGGAQLLFARLAEAIAKSDKAQVAVVDYHDGFIRQYLKKYPGVSFILYIEGKTFIKDTTIIVPLSHLVELRYMLDPASLKCNCLFWSIHPSNIKHILYGAGRAFFYGRKEKAILLLRIMSVQGHVVFMDGANKLACEKEIGQLECSTILPVPLNTEAGSQHKVWNHKSSINIAWLGRISYDKVNSIKKIVTDISSCQLDIKINLHIIGSGSEEENLKIYAISEGVFLHQMGILEGHYLNQFLNNNIDIGIAMGTSCLEIGALSVPVALIDYSLNKLPDDANYDWLYDTPDFSLGNDAAWGFVRAKTLSDLINEVRNDKNNTIGSKCFEYVRDYHSLPKVATMLVDHININPFLDNAQIIELERILNPRLHSLFFRIIRVFVKIVRIIEYTISKKLLTSE
jgi:hypothetical protein